ncbi:unnamed protein product [Polarella glacialis]|uniref:SAP domain-containing protein n=1 Tax=Polarella glacialis TaxID=89957 RepID=A0A813G8C5_POLGL|nr:unnamed protein product [Polarella glacialis]
MVFKPLVKPFPKGDVERASATDLQKALAEEGLPVTGSRIELVVRLINSIWPEEQTAQAQAAQEQTAQAQGGPAQAGGGASSSSCSSSAPASAAKVVVVGEASPVTPQPVQHERLSPEPASTQKRLGPTGSNPWDPDESAGGAPAQSKEPEQPGCQRARRRLRRRQLEPLAEGAVLPEPGSQEDCRVPAKPRNGKVQAAVWFFCRLRITDDRLVAAGKLEYERAWCIVANCSCPEIKRDGSNTSNLVTHLENRRNLSSKMQEKQAAGQCQCGAEECSPGAPHSAPGSRAEHLAAARLRVQKEQKDTQDSKAEAAGQRTDTGELLLPLEPKIQHLLNQAWVRLVVVGDLRKMSFAEGEGFRKFTRLLVATLGSSHIWDPPGHSVQHGILQQELTFVMRSAQQTLAEVASNRKTLHFDGWTDRWNRVWMLGVVWWLDTSEAKRWKFNRVVFCLHMTSVWSSDDAGSQRCSGPAASALRSAWRSWSLGSFPSWGCSDSAAPAVATSKKLGLVAKRCLVHFLNIPVQRTCHAQKKKGTRTLSVAPDNHPAPAYLLAYEKLRAICLALTDSDLSKAFCRAAARLEVKYLGKDELACSPKVDSSAKWGTTAAMGTASVAARAVLEDMAENLPELPSDDAWLLIVEANQALDPVGAAVSKLQSDFSLLANYLPVTCGLRRALAKINTPFCNLYSTQLDGVETRNLDIPLQGLEGARWETYRHLASCASLAHPRQRPSYAWALDTYTTKGATALHCSASAKSDIRMTLPAGTHVAVRGPPGASRDFLWVFALDSWRHLKERGCWAAKKDLKLAVSRSFGKAVRAELEACPDDARDEDERVPLRIVARSGAAWVPGRLKGRGAAEKEVKWYQGQNSPELLIPRAAWGRIVRDIIKDKPLALVMKFQSSALDCLQFAAEGVVVDMFADANLLTIHRKKKTLLLSDLALTRRLSRRYG